jgi:hypothetical protein
MSTKSHVFARPFLLFAALASVFVVAGSASAQEPSASPLALKGVTTNAPASEVRAANYIALDTENTTSSLVDDGLHQGIKLHGHWIIDVKNPDGKLVQHRDFQNSILYDGQQYLTALMSGYAVAGTYAIYFANNGATNTNAVCTAGQFPYCAIVQSTTASLGPQFCSFYQCVGGLTVTPTFGVGPTVKLAGNITAPNAGIIAVVYTAPSGCNAQGVTTVQPTSVATITPAQCMVTTGGYSMGGTSTGTTLASPVSVVAGQIIQITVTLSFS